MKNFTRFFILLTCVCGIAVQISAQADKAQVLPTTVLTGNSQADAPRGYTLGTGDVIEIKVLGEKDFDGNYTVDENGQISLSFANKPIQVSCRTEHDVLADITAAYKKYLKNPQINLRIIEKNSRPQAVISGEVRSAARIEMNRSIRLVELLSFAGGVTDKAYGTIQVVHTQPLQCAEPGEQSEPQPTADGLNVPIMIYKMSDLRDGKNEANPIIRPGDVVVVEKAPPVYIVGEVRTPPSALEPITIAESGLTLSEAVARAGGLTREAKKKDVKVYRLKKAGSRERETIAANLDLIKKGTQEDLLLQPYDVIEVEKAPKSIGRVLSDIALGGGQAFVNALPLRVVY